MSDVTTQWYYSVGSERLGPVSAAELKQLADNEKITATSLVWKKGMAEWVPATKIKGLIPAQTSAAPMPLSLDDPSEMPWGDGVAATGARGRRLAFAIAGTVGVLAIAFAIGLAATRNAKPPTPSEEPPTGVAAVDPTTATPTPVPIPTPKPISERQPEPVSVKPRPWGEGDKLTVEELLSRYQKDGEGSGARYNGANITITGRLFYPADKHSTGEIVLQIPGTDVTGPCVWCRMAADPKLDTSQFRPDANVTIRGRCIGAGAEKGPREYGPAKNNEVVLADCQLIGEALIPTPAGADYPKSITLNDVEVRVTAIQHGHLTVELASGGKAGATAKTQEKYLILRLQVRNKRSVAETYGHPTGTEMYLRDERGNRFAYRRSGVKIDPDSVVARELKANPKLRCVFKDESTSFIIDSGEAETYFLIFSPENLGKGKQLVLSVDRGVFGNPLQPPQYFRFEQKDIEILPDISTAPKPPEPVRPPDPAVIEKVSAFAGQLAKGKTPTDRIKAAEELQNLGMQAKSATGALCQAILDPTPTVRVAAIHALEAVNPEVHGPIARITTPLTDFDFKFPAFGKRGDALANLVKLGDEGRVAVPVLITYKRLLSRPGGWDHAAEVVKTLAELAPNDPAVVAVLIAGLQKDADPGTRLAAVTGLSRCPVSKESVAALATSTRSDTSPDVRLAAVTALAGLGMEAKAAMKSLEGAKTDADARVRAAAREALEKVK